MIIILRKKIGNLSLIEEESKKKEVHTDMKIMYKNKKLKKCKLDADANSMQPKHRLTQKIRKLKDFDTMTFKQIDLSKRRNLVVNKVRKLP